MAMLHHHASVLLDDDDDCIDWRQGKDTDCEAAAAAAADDDAVDDDDIDDDGDVDKVRLLIVGGGGNCFSFGTYFNRQLMMLTIRSNGPSTGASNSTEYLS